MSRAAVEEYRRLVERRSAGVLTPADAARLELLEDVLHELGALQEASDRPPRPPRADVQLEVVLESAGALARAFSRNIGTGGIALMAERPLPVGSELGLTLKLPGEERPLVATGKVVWVRETTMGVCFERVPEESQRRLRGLVVGSESLLQRLQQAVSRERAPEPVLAAARDSRPSVLLALTDAHLADVTRELLADQGLRALLEAAQEGAAPQALVADPHTALDAVARFPRVPLVLAGVSGRDALGGKLGSLRPAAYVKRPVNASGLVDALRRLPGLR